MLLTLLGIVCFFMNIFHHLHFIKKDGERIHLLINNHFFYRQITLFKIHAIAAYQFLS